MEAGDVPDTVSLPLADPVPVPERASLALTEPRFSRALGKPPTELDPVDLVAVLIRGGGPARTRPQAVPVDAAASTARWSSTPMHQEQSS
jgi:hypothetical protein